LDYKELVGTLKLEAWLSESENLTTKDESHDDGGPGQNGLSGIVDR